MGNAQSTTPSVSEEDNKESEKLYAPSNYNNFGSRLRSKIFPKPTDWVHTTVPFEMPSKQVYYDKTMPVRSKQQFFLAIFMVLWGFIGGAMSFYGACVDLEAIGPYFEVKARYYTDNEDDFKKYNATAGNISTWTQEGWNDFVTQIGHPDWKKE